MGEGIDLRFDDSNEVKEYPLCLPSCDGSLINLIWAFMYQILCSLLLGK
ncbi:hypothetical protein TorRG33x02_305540 [Trema orientale]|uniref:Uncharacterized protein n=1 Tax=Trema orientale TaxID=63057 RepID=A0A2P5BXC4_TREOI|nr:hypothetical protein TorRG33x02_305540 [Trema orientale]